MLVNPNDDLRWHKYHSLSHLPLGIGLQSVFDKPLVYGELGYVKFGFELSLISRFLDNWNVVSSMIFRGHSDHTTDKVYLPAEVVADEIHFVPFVISPEAEYHKIEFHRKDGVYAVAGRHGEENAFGLSYDGHPYLRLAFPNETGRFPDTYILFESCKDEYDIVKVSSDFTHPRKFKVGEPVVIKWQVVGFDDAPECLKKVVKNLTEGAKNKAKAREQILRASAIMRS